MLPSFAGAARAAETGACALDQFLFPGVACNECDPAVPGDCARQARDGRSLACRQTAEEGGKEIWCGGVYYGGHQEPPEERDASDEGGPPERPSILDDDTSHDGGPPQRPSILDERGLTPEGSIPGTVACVSAGRLGVAVDRDMSMWLQQGTRIDFVVGSGTAIESDGAGQRDAGSIACGEYVTVTYVLRGKDAVASEIHAWDSTRAVDAPVRPEAAGITCPPCGDTPPSASGSSARGSRDDASRPPEGRSAVVPEAEVPQRRSAGDRGELPASHGERDANVRSDATTGPAGDPYQAGMALYRAKRYAESVERFTAAARADPGRSDAFLQRGRAYTRLDRGDEAIADFTKAAQLDARSGAALFERANALQTYYPNRPRSALDDLNEALRREPRNALYLNRRGALLHETNQFEAAIEDFDRAVAIEPTMGAAYCNRGLAKYWLDRRDEAEKDFRSCLAYEPSLESYLREQVAQIPAARQWIHDFQQWYADIQRDAAATRDDACGSKYGSTGSRVANCRSHGFGDTEDRIKHGDL